MEPTASNRVIARFRNYHKTTRWLELVIPENVSGIYDNAFNGCESLVKIKFEDSENNIGLGASGYSYKSLFKDCPLEEVYMGRNIGLYYASGQGHDYLPFYNKRTLKKLTIGSKVTIVKDYKTLKQTDADGNVTDMDMPDTSNVLQFYTEDNTKVSVRPSGTEPKIKFYIEVKGILKSAADYVEADALAAKKIEAVRASLGI